MCRFKDSLSYGQIGEGRIANWLKLRGYCVMPVYEKEVDNGKGPRIFMPPSYIENLIAPDMFIFNKEKAMFIEAKRKSAFSWYRNGGYWTTGIDLKHYLHYCKVEEISPFKVYLMFLQEGGRAKDSPQSPSGLYYNSLEFLRDNEDHRSNRWGNHGMVYWKIDSLKKRAELEEMPD